MTANEQKVADKVKEAFIPNDSSMDAYLYLEGKKYELQAFETEFQQPEDFKGQPQHEVKGGLISVTIKQKTDEMINRWMFGRNIVYDGIVELAPITRISNAPIIITFTKGSCISYQKFAGIDIGICIKLLISAKSITINKTKHTNQPKFYA